MMTEIKTCREIVNELNRLYTKYRPKLSDKAYIGKRHWTSDPEARKQIDEFYERKYIEVKDNPSSTESNPSTESTKP